MTYGLVPDGWKQFFPREGAPRNIDPGEKVYVYVGFAYDGGFPPSASAGKITFGFERGEEGFKPLGKIRGFVVPE